MKIGPRIDVSNLAQELFIILTYSRESTVTINARSTIEMLHTKCLISQMRTAVVAILDRLLSNISRGRSNSMFDDKETVGEKSGKNRATIWSGRRCTVSRIDQRKIENPRAQRKKKNMASSYLLIFYLDVSCLTCKIHV